jgi:hypothetical protein
MNSFTQIKQDNQGRAAVNAQRESARASFTPAQFVDDRPGAVVQKQLHETLNQSSAVVSQLRLQQSLNQGPRFAEQAKLADFLSVGRGGTQRAIPRQEVKEDDGAEIERDQSAIQRVAMSAISAEEPREDDNPVQRESAPVQRRKNNTGMPDNLKRGVKNLSGLAMDDVRVHYNSAKPAQLRALAYTQGTNIHVGPGQETHLGHEAWHVVQQKQGRVQATMQTKGVAINDDSSLEREADVMGARAAGLRETLQRKSGCACDQYAAQQDSETVQARSESTSESPALISPGRHAATGELVQLAKVVKVPSEDDGDLEYVVVDVPGDGSCLLHAFNLGLFTRQLLTTLYESFDPASLTPDEVEQIALDDFRNKVLGEESEADVQTAFDLTGEHTRFQVGVRWWNNLNTYLPSLRSDIQTIVYSLLTREGLERRELEGEPDISDPESSLSNSIPLPSVLSGGSSPSSPSLSPPGPSNSITSSLIDIPQSIPQSSPAEMDDFDFLFNAAYYPERLKKVSATGASSKTGLTKSTPSKGLSRAMFAVTTGEIKNMRIPMGVQQDGLLANYIREYIIQLGTPHAVGGYLPLHSIVMPPPANIPVELVEAYVQEFGSNMELWASETTLRTASEIKGAQVCLHSFSDEDEWHGALDLPGETETVNLYETGAQTHFQMMIGPFAPGWLSGPELLTEEQTNTDIRPMETVGPGPFEMAHFSAFSESLGEVFEGGSLLGYFDATTSDLDPEQIAYINEVVEYSGMDFLSPGAVIERIYRAAAEMDIKNVFDLPPKAAAQAIEQLEDIYREREAARAKSSGHMSQRDPIIPLAGFVSELVDKFHIPNDEIGRLLPYVNDYLAFHGKRSTWKATEAGPRTEALRGMAHILNEWADEYDAPELRRGPSIAEYSTIDSPFQRSEEVGTAMRSLLTINPGDLVGYEPEESATWLAFKEALGGFVRAHVLNKHLGGPGLPRNIAYMSSEDNTRMSRMGEEYVKRQVIENNKQMFFGVKMPLGRPELMQSPYLLGKQFTDVMVSEVSMQTGVVEPFINENEEKDLLFTNVFLKDMLGIKDDDVRQSTEGALSFTTKPPDPNYTSKIQPHHRNVRARAEEESTNLTLVTMWQPEPVKDIVIEAERALNNAGATGERDQILKQAADSLKPLVTPQTFGTLMLELGKIRRLTGAVATSYAKTEQKATKRAKTGGRAEFLRTHNIDESSKLFKMVTTASDGKFKQMQALIAEGATAEAAVVNGLKSKKEFNQALEGLRRVKKGTDIQSLFRK